MMAQKLDPRQAFLQAYLDPQTYQNYFRQTPETQAAYLNAVPSYLGQLPQYSSMEQATQSLNAGRASSDMQLAQAAAQRAGNMGRDQYAFPGETPSPVTTLSNVGRTMQPSPQTVQNAPIAIRIDTANNKVYARVNGVWRSVEPTPGFSYDYEKSTWVVDLDGTPMPAEAGSAPQTPDEQTFAEQQTAQAPPSTPPPSTPPTAPPNGWTPGAGSGAPGGSSPSGTPPATPPATPSGAPDQTGPKPAGWPEGLPWPPTKWDLIRVLKRDKNGKAEVDDRGAPIFEYQYVPVTDYDAIHKIMQAYGLGAYKKPTGSIDQQIADALANGKLDEANSLRRFRDQPTDMQRQQFGIDLLKSPGDYFRYQALARGFQPTQPFQNGEVVPRTISPNGQPQALGQPGPQGQSFYGAQGNGMQQGSFEGQRQSGPNGEDMVWSGGQWKSMGVFGTNNVSTSQPQGFSLYGGYPALQSLAGNGGPIGQARQLPSLGAPQFPSLQSYNNLLPSERETFNAGIQAQGFPLEDYLAQLNATFPKSYRTGMISTAHGRI